MSRFVLKSVAVGGVAAGGYCTGAYLERRRAVASLERSLSIDGAILEGVLSSGDRFKSLPGLPIFGTVSAATPVSVSGTEIAAGPARVSQIMKFGFPGLDNVRSLDNYVLSYDRRNRVAHWVFEHLTREALQPAQGVDRSLCDFHPDKSVHPFFRSENSDYKGSGFDRGHLAAAGNHRLNQKHVDQTFLLSNMAPQVGVGFNRHKWNELEKYVRKLTNKYANVYVCTGCLYLPCRERDGKTYVRYQVIGANSVAVPTHFYKVVVGEGGGGELHLEAYCLPNEKIEDATPLLNFRVPPDTIERASGLLFFDKIQRNKLLSINGKKQ